MKRTVEVDRTIALMGAEARVRQLQAEVQVIFRMFPELRRQRPSSAEAVIPGSTTRKKRVFSPKGKRAISAGMRKYWTRRRAQAKAVKGTRAAD